MDDEMQQSSGLSRRDVMKRGAIVGGALVWATPVVQSLASPAFAAGSGGDTGAVCTEFFRLKVTVNNGAITGIGTDTVAGNCGDLDSPFSGYTLLTSGSISTDMNSVRFTLPGGHVVTVTITDAAGKCFRVDLPADCKVEATVIKSGRQNGMCDEPESTTFCTGGSGDSDQLSTIVVAFCCA